MEKTCTTGGAYRIIDNCYESIVLSLRFKARQWATARRDSGSVWKLV